jgi:integrase
MAMSNTGKQLYTLVLDFELYSHYSLGKLTTKDGNNMPHITWPDGTPCMLANLYMLELRDRPGRRRGGLSRRGRKGGTMGAYAGKISQLIRYCYQKKWDLIELTDDKFTRFIRTIRAEVAEYNPEAKKKNETTITDVGRVCLDFLHFVGRFYGDDNFVANEGSIRGRVQEFEKKSKNGNATIKQKYWHHHSFSDGDRIRTRSPITNANIDLLKKANHELNASRFITIRRRCLMSLLEHTGARIGELAELRAYDVIKADKMKQPMLRLTTLKKSAGEHRLIPAHRLLLSELKRYIRMHRSCVVKKTIGKAADHGLFFVSETTGNPLTAETLGGEIYKLRKYAGINEQTCSHMFRHAFITNLFVLLIQRHEFENPGDFRKALLDEKTFKAEVMQWTGHSQASALDRYIHLAFSEVAGYASTMSSVYLIRAQEMFDEKLSQLTTQLQEGMPVAEYMEKLEELQRNRDEDFSIAQQFC